MRKSKAVNNVVTIEAGSEDLVLMVSKYGFKDTGFPELRLNVHYPEICIKEEEDPVLDGIRSYRLKERDREYYLSPFRLYCYQISGDINGGGDYGSTQVIGLMTLFLSLLDGDGSSPSNVRWGLNGNLNRSHAMFHVFKSIAYDCLNSFYEHGGNSIYMYDGYKANFSPDENCKRFVDKGDMIDQYTMAVIIMLAIRSGRWHLIDREYLNWYYKLPRYTENGEKIDTLEKRMEYDIAIPMDIFECMCAESEE